MPICGYRDKQLVFFKLRNILIKELNEFEEIILIGSGKGVTSVKSIKEISWKRKSLNKFKEFSKYYRLAMKKCNHYKF